MNVIGISAFFHDSACCLLQSGQLTAAVQEERFSRNKNERRLPIRAFRYCLEVGRLAISDIDCVAYFECPVRKLSRQLAMRIPDAADPTFSWLDARKPVREIRQRLGFDGPIEFFPHHHSHAASSFFFSGFESSSILTLDAVGEWATTSYGLGKDDGINILDEVCFPHSLGLFYSAVTQYLGFRVLRDEYKVMGLAPYGREVYVDRLLDLIRLAPDGKFQLNQRFFDFTGQGCMYSAELIQRLGLPPREPDSEITPFHQDVAKSLQTVLEDVVVAQARRLRKMTGSPNLCLAGGVALNCVANAKIRDASVFERIFVQPAAGDAGSALGAAALAHAKLTGARHSYKPIEHVYLGPGYSNDTVAEVLRATEIEHLDFRGKTELLLDAVVDRLSRGQVIAWFQGRMEFGPRALGNRSILADPRRPDMRDRINALIKKREAFRPFAPALLEDCASAHLEIGHPSPFMTETCQVRSSLPLPAITHVDGSCRPQTVSSSTNPRLANLLGRFHRRTGCPVLVNTSFNVRGEPIVCTPADALRCLANSELDVLVMEDFIVDRCHIESVLNAARPLIRHLMQPSGAHVDYDAAYTFI